MLTSISRYFMTLLLRFSDNRSKKTRWTSKQTFWFESRGLSMRERNIQSSFLYLWSNPPSLFDRRLNCQFWRILSNNNYLLGLGFLESSKYEKSDQNFVSLNSTHSMKLNQRERNLAFEVNPTLAVFCLLFLIRLQGPR